MFLDKKRLDMPSYRIANRPENRAFRELPKTDRSTCVSKPFRTYLQENNKTIKHTISINSNIQHFQHQREQKRSRKLYLSLVQPEQRRTEFEVRTWATPNTRFLAKFVIAIVRFFPRSRLILWTLTRSYIFH